MENLETRFRMFVRDNALIDPSTTVLAAVSGGPDSMVLLHLLHRLASDLPCRVVVGHVHHGLRDREADEDASFVQSASAALGDPCVTERIDVSTYAASSKRSTQDAARQLRYEALERMRISTGADMIATAHHADDNAETVLMNLVRGTGIRGLAGIPVRRPDARVVRPLLFARRKEILEYAEAHTIPSRVDSSNASDHYLRNFLRNRVLPEWETRWGPGVVPSLNEVANVMREVDVSVREAVRNTRSRVERHGAEGTRILRGPFLAEPEFLREEYLLDVFRRLGLEPTEDRVGRLVRFFRGTPGRTMQLSSSWSAYRERSAVVVAPPRKRTTYEIEAGLGETLIVPGGTVVIGVPEPVRPGLMPPAGTEMVDAETLQAPLVVRTWKPGDRFVPLGMRSAKKVSDYFIDHKVEQRAKGRVPVIESNARIVWLCGLRLDDRFKITPRTRSAVKLTYHSSV